MGDGSLGYIRMQQLSNVPQDGFCLGEIGTVVDWGDLSKNPLDFTYRSGVDDPSNRIVDEKPSSAVSMGTARRLYENADLASFGATAPRSQTGGCEPITSIWTVECTYQGRVVAVYGYNKDIPLSVFHTLSDTDSLSDKRWFMWAPEGANMVCHLHDEISGIGVSSYRGSSIEDNALKTTNWYRQHMSEVRTRTSALVGAYRAYVKDVMDLKVPDFHHGAYAFKVGETRSEVRFDQYHMSMPNAAFKQVVAKLVATDKHMPIGFLMENVLKGYIFTGEDTMIMVNPLFHIMAKGFALATALNQGNTMILMPVPEVDSILEAIQKYKVRWMLGVPMLREASLMIGTGVTQVSDAARFLLGMENTDEATLEQAERATFDFIDRTARAEGVQATRRTLARFEPVVFDNLSKGHRAAIRNGKDYCPVVTGDEDGLGNRQVVDVERGNVGTSSAVHTCQRTALALLPRKSAS